MSGEPGGVALVAPVAPALGKGGRCAAVSYGCAPARPRCGRGFSRRPAAFAKTAGRSRPPAGLIRPQRSVPQVADEGNAPRLWTRPRRGVGRAITVLSRLGVGAEGVGPPARGRSVRRRRASDGSGPQGAGHGRPAVFAEPGWRIENPHPKPAPMGAQPSKHGRVSGLLSPRVAAAGAPPRWGPHPLCPHAQAAPRNRQKKAAQCAAWSLRPGRRRRGLLVRVVPCRA